MYQYKAIIRKVVDGDTMEIDIDLGLSIWVRNEKIRLYGIDTPEVFGVKKGSPEWDLGNKASEFVKRVVLEGQEVIIETYKDKKEKFGRFLANVFVMIEEGELAGLAGIRNIGDHYCLNDILVAKNLAVRYMV
jgi:micrococcal nuclease